MKIEKGSTLVIQTHYTPNGTRQDDRSYVGLKLADLKTVKRQVRYGMAVNPFIEIPPGADDYVLEAAQAVPARRAATQPVPAHALPGQVVPLRGRVSRRPPRGAARRAALRFQLAVAVRPGRAEAACPRARS